MSAIGGDGTAWFIAITGAITGIGALVLNRRSQREQNTLQEAANKVADDKHRLEETQQALTSLEAALDRANAEAEKYRTRAGALEDELDEQKALARTMYSAQEARCREYAAGLTEAVLVLRQVVTDEIAASAADTALQTEPHPHDAGDD